MYDSKNISTPGLEDYGWTRKRGQLEIEWETEENIKKLKDKVDFVMNGCRCKTGCASNRCKCRKSMRVCGPGCQ